MIFLQPNWIVGFVIVFVFLTMGRFDAQHGGRRNFGPLWALASILVTVAVIEWFGGGWLFVLIVQATLFVAITLVRVIVEK